MDTENESTQGFAPLLVSQATKHFGKMRALDNMTFQVPLGSRTALLGPNGAGKTTLLRSISGQLKLDSGSIQIFGHTPDRESLSRIGFVPQELAIYQDLTARENLSVFGKLHGLRGKRLENAVSSSLDWIGLAERQKELVKHFSGGMKRRVNIACGCLHEPSLLLLDEPTVGVDPQSRQRIFEMLCELQVRGTTLVLTTHHLDEAESQCDFIVIVDRGRTIAQGTLDQIVNDSLGSGAQVSVVIEGQLRKPPDPLVWNPQTHRWCIPVGDVHEHLPLLMESIRDAGGRIADLQIQSASLNEVFLSLTGRELRE